MNDDKSSPANLQKLEEELTKIENTAKTEDVSSINNRQVTPDPVSADTSNVPVEDKSPHNETYSQQPQPQFPQPLQESPQNKNEAQGSAPAQIINDLQAEEKIPQSNQLLTNDKKSSKTIVLIAVILFILSIAGLTLYFIGSRSIKPEAESSPVPTEISIPKETLNPTAGWKIYSSTFYNVKHPQELTPMEEGDIMVLSKQGPTQKEGTEMFDGYVISFQAKESGNLTIENYVQAKIDEIKQKEVSTVKSSPVPVSINNYQGLTYIEEGLGTFEQIILQPASKDVFLEISVIVADPGKIGFQEVVDQILSTLTIISSNPSPSVSPTASSSAVPSIIPTSTP